MDTIHARRRRAPLGRAGIALIAIVMISRTGATQPARRSAAAGDRRPAASNSTVQVWPVRGGVSMLVGADANTTVQVGSQGTLVVDTQPAEGAAQLVTALRSLTPQPIRFIVNTSIDADHVGGNVAMAKAGDAAFAGNRPDVIAQTGGAPIYAHENLLTRLVSAGAPSESWPTSTYFVKQRDLFVNGEAVQLFHPAPAHSDTDTIVFFRRTDVISAGDVFTSGRYPVIDVDKGGSIDGLLDALNFLIDLAVPESNEEGGTLIVPGHGRLSDEADLCEYRDMVAIVRDRILALARTGMSLEAIKADKPTRDFDGVYDTPAVRAEAFVESVFRTLPPEAVRRQP